MDEFEPTYHKIFSGVDTFIWYLIFLYLFTLGIEAQTPKKSKSCIRKCITYILFTPFYYIDVLEYGYVLYAADAGRSWYACLGRLGSMNVYVSVGSE